MTDPEKQQHGQFPESKIEEYLDQIIFATIYDSFTGREDLIAVCDEIRERLIANPLCQNTNRGLLQY